MINHILLKYENLLTEPLHSKLIGYEEGLATYGWDMVHSILYEEEQGLFPSREQVRNDNLEFLEFLANSLLDAVTQRGV